MYTASDVFHAKNLFNPTMISAFDLQIIYTILGNNGKSFIIPCSQEDLNKFSFIGPRMFLIVA